VASQSAQQHQGVTFVDSMGNQGFKVTMGHYRYHPNQGDDRTNHCATADCVTHEDARQGKSDQRDECLDNAHVGRRSEMCGVVRQALEHDTAQSTEHEEACPIGFQDR
jgi:hypothetical protein